MRGSIVFALSAVVCVITYVVWNQHGAPEPPARAPLTSGLLRTSPARPSPIPSSPPPVVASGSPSARGWVISEANQKLIRACLEQKPDTPRVHMTETMTLEDLVTDLKNSSLSGAAASPQNLVMNFHLRKSDGTRLRLHIEPRDREAKNSESRWPLGGSDLRVFGVDAQGLPIEEPFPKELKLESIKSVIDNFAAGGHITFRERRFHQNLSAGHDLSVDIVETADHADQDADQTVGPLRISQLQLFFSGRSLGCAWSPEKNLSCKCL